MYCIVAVVVLHLHVIWYMEHEAAEHAHVDKEQSITKSI
jgi:hypothetical protein